MKTISANDLQMAMANASGVLIDVRSMNEFRQGHIEGSINMPLDTIAHHESWLKQQSVWIICQSGNRSHMACQQLAAMGLTDITNVDGGISGWAKENRPLVHKKKTRTIAIMRQVMIVAGLLILLGLALQRWVHPNGILLTAMVGLGLTYAGVSGQCMMSTILGMMPWNRS